MSTREDVRRPLSAREFPWRKALFRADRLRRRFFRHFTRWRTLSAENPLGDLEWNELPEGQGEELNDGLVSLLAFDTGGTPAVLGTGYIIRGDGRTAFGVTAAHVLWDAAHKAQNPNPRSHPSTPHFFQSDFELVHVGPKRLRAAFVNRGKAALPTITSVIWDKRADVAFFTLSSEEDEGDPGLFETHFPVTEEAPRIGQRVGVLAYADMDIPHVEDGSGFRSFSVARRLVLRVGRVTASHPLGHLLCRGPCIETSIPVFAGMSGGVAFAIPKPGDPLEAFGVLSGDSDEPRELKQNRWESGASIVALLPVDAIEREGSIRRLSLRVENIGVGILPPGE